MRPGLRTFYIITPNGSMHVEDLGQTATINRGADYDGDGLDWPLTVTAGPGDRAGLYRSLGSAVFKTVAGDSTGPAHTGRHNGRACHFVVQRAEGANGSSISVWNDTWVVDIGLANDKLFPGIRRRR